MAVNPALTTQHEAYVAVRFPPNHVLFHLIHDPDRDAPTYEEISRTVISSVREALDAMGVEVFESDERDL